MIGVVLCIYDEFMADQGRSWPRGCFKVFVFSIAIILMIIIIISIVIIVMIVKILIVSISTISFIHISNMNDINNTYVLIVLAPPLL